MVSLAFRFNPTCLCGRCADPCHMGMVSRSRSAARTVTSVGCTAEEACVTSKALLEVLWSLLRASDSILEILLCSQRCAVLFLSVPSCTPFSVQNIASIQNTGVSRKVFLTP